MTCGAEFFGCAYFEERFHSCRPYSLSLQILRDQRYVGTVRLDVIVQENQSPVVSEDTSESDAWCMVDGATVTGPKVQAVPGESEALSAMPSASALTRRDVEAPARPMCKSEDPVPVMPPVPGVPAVPQIPREVVDGGRGLEELSEEIHRLEAQSAHCLEAILSTLAGPSISVNSLKRGAFHAPEPVNENLRYLKASGASKEPLKQSLNSFKMSHLEYSLMTGWLRCLRGW